MTILTKNTVLKFIDEKKIVISPNLDIFQIQDHAIDIRLGYTFLIPKSWTLTKNGREAIATSSFDKPNAGAFDVVELEEGQYFELLPGEFVIVSTLESITLPNDLIGVLYPRSSVNRRGLSLDLTGLINAGYEGQLTIPMKNNTHSQTLRLYPGERICQIAFDELEQPIKPKKSKYHNRDIIEGPGTDAGKEAKLIVNGATRELKEKFKHE
jgi:dCTP deaminase